jgi:hypothetical protein
VLLGLGAAGFPDCVERRLSVDRDGYRDALAMMVTAAQRASAFRVRDFNIKRN